MNTLKSAVSFACLVGLVGCSQAVPKELADARSAYSQAAKGPARELNPAQLHSARVSLAFAEETFDAEGTSTKARDRAYIAARKAQLADVNARILLSERETQRWQQQAEEMERRALMDARRDLSQTQQQLAGSQQQLEAERQRREEAERRAQQAAAELARIASVKQEDRGMVITLSGAVLFKSGKSDLMPTAEEKLSQVANTLVQGDPASNIVVEGHTDSQGSDSYNQRLSEQRAQAVRSFLVSHGLGADRVTARGMGESQPVADNESPEGRANNRRVEIVVEPPRGAAASAQPGQMQQQPGQQSPGAATMGGPQGAATPSSTPAAGQMGRPADTHQHQPGMHAPGAQPTPNTGANRSRTAPTTPGSTTPSLPDANSGSNQGGK